MSNVVFLKGGPRDGEMAGLAEGQRRLEVAVPPTGHYKHILGDPTKVWTWHPSRTRHPVEDGG